MNCPACAGSGPFALAEKHRDPFAGGEYSLYRCPDCGLVFSDPMKNPGPEWYGAYTGAWTAGKGATPPSHWRIRWLAGLFPGTGPKPGLLDVGCGYGSFMAGAAGAGFECWGVDFDAERTGEAAAAGRVFTGTLESFSAENPGRRFGVVTAFQTLEHLEDPAGFLRLARELTEPGGLLLADVPNADRAFAGTLALIDYPPHHLTRWTAAALKAALERAGFRVERVDSVMELANFYDHVFSLITVNLSALFKKLRYGGTLAGQRLKPMEKASGGAGPDMGAAGRARLVAAAKAVYYLLFWLPALPAAAATVLYCRLSGRGMFLAATARRPS